MADDEDKARVGYVVNNYDTIKPGIVSRENKMVNKYGKTVFSPTVEISKTINGTVVVATAVPDTKWNELRLVSAYVNKKKVFQMPDANAPGGTSENVSESPSKIKISQNAEGVNSGGAFSIRSAPSIEQLDQTNSLIETDDGDPVAQFSTDGSVSLSISSFEDSGRSYTIRHFLPLV